MTSRQYKTAQGRTIDLGALVLRNETERAVGNMGVNARGDIIDSLNRPIETKTQQTRRHYDRQATGGISNARPQATREDK